VSMCPEIHVPTMLKSKMVDDYVEFIEKQKTKHFGINVDFSVFQDHPVPMFEGQDMSNDAFQRPWRNSYRCCPIPWSAHAKFVNMTDDFVETTTPV